VSRVAIGMPVRNGGNFLRESLSAVLAQTHEDIDVLVSDNASTDDTAEIVQSVAAGDHRVRYVRHDHDLGARRNHNYVLTQAAESAYCVWASHDDVMAPTFVERCVAKLAADRHAVLCFTQFDVIDEWSLPVSSAVVPTTFAASTPAARVRAFWSSPRVHQTMYGVMRRETVERVGLLRPWFGSDRALLIDLALQGDFACVDEVLFHHREHPDRSGEGEHRHTRWAPDEGPERGYWRRAGHAVGLWRAPGLTARERAGVVGASLQYGAVRSAHWVPQLGRELRYGR
jgi:glycosyltransferase involved in cell wall biosynthesis